MAPIQVLQEDVINKIAAGEIIERPVSIVKELIENSLDAGSTEIRVEIEKGGRQLIRITDNGCGIASREAQLAFERHATSKIRTQEDLLQVGTMGFRGEALASIAAVSQVTMKTRCAQEDTGLSLHVVGGKFQSSHPIAAAQGTAIESRNLFFNIPARKKFLKSDASEAAAISHIMNAFALAHPEIGFWLLQDQREVLSCPKTSTTRERIFQIFGAELLDGLLEIEEALYHYRITAFVSSPDSLRTNKNYQYFYINRRYVKDKVLANSVYVAYRVFAETGQYPAAFLFLEMPQTMVDVNVHPAKYEVRFLQQPLVQKGIIDAIQKRLREARPLPQFQLAAKTYIPTYSTPEMDLSRADADIQRDVQTVLPDPRLAPAPPQRKLPEEGEYKLIGQYDNTYILLSDAGGLIIVDQHVAHERILYEQLMEKDSARNRASQNLLIPLVLEANPAQMMLLEDYASHFQEFGLEMEIFGSNSIIVRRIPEMISDGNYSAAIQRLINDLEKLYREGMLQSFDDEIRKSLACQAAVKINMPLTMEKMEYVIRQLLRAKTPQVCPHGRPIILRISHYEIQKNFRRI